MNNTHTPILHVDGSLTEYIDKRGILHKIAGLGGYLVVNGQIVDKFYRQLKDNAYLHHHEDYAIIEGMKWVKDKGYKHIKIKSDSLSSVNLFSYHKKLVNKIDKFFLVQYMALEFEFENIDIAYHKRSDDDLCHNLSRSYMKDLPKDIIRLHCDNHKKKYDYEIVADAAFKSDQEIKKALHDNMKVLLAFK
jgi:ribonuclease HI